MIFEPSLFPAHYTELPPTRCCISSCREGFRYYQTPELLVIQLKLRTHSFSSFRYNHPFIQDGESNFARILQFLVRLLLMYTTSSSISHFIICLYYLVLAFLIDGVYIYNRICSGSTTWISIFLGSD